MQKLPLLLDLCSWSVISTFSGLDIAHHAPVSLLFLFSRDESVLSGPSQYRGVSSGLQGTVARSHAGKNSPST